MVTLLDYLFSTMYQQTGRCPDISDNTTLGFDVVMNVVNNTNNGSVYNACRILNGSEKGSHIGRSSDAFDRNGEIRIPLYCLIFVLSLIGNLLVIITLAQNRRMRTVTNVFLLNLSISDLLLAVFCMPFTLVPQLMRNFIFGEVVCIAIRYFQGKTQHFIYCKSG